MAMVGSGQFVQNFAAALQKNKENAVAYAKIEALKKSNDIKFATSISEFIKNYAETGNKGVFKASMDLLLRANDIDPRHETYRSFFDNLVATDADQLTEAAKMFSGLAEGMPAGMVSRMARMVMNGNGNAVLDMMKKFREAQKVKSRKAAVASAVEANLNQTRTIPATTLPLITKEALPGSHTLVDSPGSMVPLVDPGLNAASFGMQPGMEMRDSIQDITIPERVEAVEPTSGDFLRTVTDILQNPDATTDDITRFVTAESMTNVNKDMTLLRTSLAAIAAGKPDLADPRISAKVDNVDDAKAVLKQLRSADEGLAEIMESLLLIMEDR